MCLPRWWQHLGGYTGHPKAANNRLTQPGSVMHDDERVLDLDALRSQFCALVEIHPPERWSAGLLMAAIGLIEAVVVTHGLDAVRERRDLGPRLRLVRDDPVA